MLNVLFKPVFHQSTFFARIDFFAANTSCYATISITQQKSSRKKKQKHFLLLRSEKTRQPITMLKVCHMIQTSMISFKQTHANENNSCNKQFTIQIEQIFRCCLKTTQLINIKHYLQRNSKPCCYHLKSKERRMIVGFIANKYKKCLHVNYQKQLYIKIKLTRGKHCQDIDIKKREFC